MSIASFKEELYDKLKVLNETVWENQAERLSINAWLRNFKNEKERIQALFLLSQFLFFGSRQIRELLRALYRDLYKYPKIETVRKRDNDTTDLTYIRKKFNEELRKTRFLGIGNPSESGTHLLYFFRQENKLPKSLFIQSHEIFERFGQKKKLKLGFPDVKHYVFIDDLCGSGTQALRYSKKIIQDLKSLNKEIRADYLTLFSLGEAKKKVEKDTEFDYVDSVFELDESFRCFNKKSRYFQNIPPGIDLDFAKKMCQEYGRKLMYSICKLEGVPKQKLSQYARKHSLGFENGQLLIGLHHNTPDNTLPIIWYDEDEVPWYPIIKRYNKNYG